DRVGDAAVGAFPGAPVGFGGEFGEVFVAGEVVVAAGVVVVVVPEHAEPGWAVAGDVVPEVAGDVAGHGVLQGDVGGGGGGHRVAPFSVRMARRLSTMRPATGRASSSQASARSRTASVSAL